MIPLLGDGLFVSDGAIWRKRRRIVAPIIHLARLPDFAPVMIKTLLEARDRWGSPPPAAEIEVLVERAQLTAAIISRTIFGSKLGHAHVAEVVRGFADYQRHIMKIDSVPPLGLPDWFPRWYSPRTRRAVRRIHAVLDRVIESAQRQRDCEDVSIIGRLLDARDPDTGEALYPQAIRNEAAVLFMAGHKTTANTLAWAWYILSFHSRKFSPWRRWPGFEIRIYSVQHRSAHMCGDGVRSD